MTPPAVYQLVINVGGDADPALVEALLEVVSRLQLVPQAVEVPAEFQFVSEADLTRFLRGHGVTGGVAEKTHRSWSWLIRSPIKDLLVVVCPSCNGRMGVCRCPDRGFEFSRGQVHGLWGYRSRIQWHIGLQSLLDLDVALLGRVNASSRARLLAFIEHLHGVWEQEK